MPIKTENLAGWKVVWMEKHRDDGYSVCGKTQWIDEHKQTPFGPQGIRHRVTKSWTIFSSAGITHLNLATPTQKSLTYVLREPGRLSEFIYTCVYVCCAVSPPSPSWVYVTLGTRRFYISGTKFVLWNRIGRNQILWNHILPHYTL